MPKLIDSSPVRAGCWVDLRTYRLYTRVIGSTVELHAEDPRTGQRYVARSSDFATAWGELAALVGRCTADGESAAGQRRLRRAVGAVAERLRRLLLGTSDLVSVRRGE